MEKQNKKFCRALSGGGGGAGDGGRVSTFSYILEEQLPSSIWHEIFFKLQIKDVKTCRSVCKHWRNIISDPDFSVLYTKNMNYSLMLYFHYDHRLNPLHQIYLFEIPRSGGGGNNYLSTQIVPPNLFPGWFDGYHAECISNFTLIGSCNGFICLKKSMDFFDTLYVVNPILGCRDFISLPKVDSLVDVRYFFGSGQDNGVMVVMRYVLETKIRSRSCEIFAVGRDSDWRSWSSVVSIGRMARDSEVADLNGVLHWLPEIVLPNFLHTFDLAKEEPGRVPTPPRISLVKKYVELRVFKNRLSLIDYYSTITIWTMQEYGVAGSWTKDVILKEWISPAGSVMNNFRTIAPSLDGNMVFGESSDNYHHDFVKSLYSYDVHQKKGSEIVEFGTHKQAKEFYSYSPSFYHHAGKWCDKDAGECSSKSDKEQEPPVDKQLEATRGMEP